MDSALLASVSGPRLVRVTEHPERLRERAKHASENCSRQQSFASEFCGLQTTLSDAVP